MGKPNNMTIVSYHKKGLIPTLQSIIPSARHWFYCHHIAENIKPAFNNLVILSKFWKACRACRPYEYDVYMNDIRSIDEHAYNYIEATGRQNWATAFVHECRYEMLTSNAAENTNSLFKDTSVLPITKNVEEIRTKLMKFFQRRYVQMQKITPRLTSYANK